MATAVKFNVSYWRWSLAGVCVLLGWLLWLAPASLLASAAAGGGLQLQGLSGSFWAGSAESARLQLAPHQGRQLVFDLGELDWQLEPASLLSLQACAQVQALLKAQQFKGRVCHSLAGTTALSDLRLQMPASFLRLMAPIEAAGQVMLALDEVTLSGNRIDTISGSGRIEQLALQVERDWLHLGNLDLLLAGPVGGPYTASLISDDQAIQWQAQSDQLTFGLAGLETRLSSRLRLSESYRLQWGNGLALLGFEARGDEYLMELQLP